MAENFRKSKIQKYYTTLKIRQTATKHQNKNGGTLFADMKFDELMMARQRGYLEAIDLILQELEHEFDLYNPDNPKSDIKKLAVD